MYFNKADDILPFICFNNIYKIMKMKPIQFVFLVYFFNSLQSKMKISLSEDNFERGLIFKDTPCLKDLRL